MFLEVFCGTAGVSASFKRLGFDNCIAVDKVRSKATLASVIPLDLLKLSSQNLIFSWIRRPEVVGVFLSPPHDTSCFARSVPKPLRTCTMPDGIDGLEGQDLMRVGQANVLYDFTSSCLDLCVELNKPCMVRNPRSSFFWSVSSMVDAQSAQKWFHQDHQACAYGSQHSTWTRLCATLPEVQSIDGLCDGKHVHASWNHHLVKQGPKRVFATSLDAQPSRELCDAITRAFCLHLAPQIGSFLSLSTSSALASAQAQAFTGKQPRGKKCPVLVPDFSSRVVTLRSESAQCFPLQSLPSHAKLLKSFPMGGSSVEELVAKANAICELFALDAVFTGVEISNWQEVAVLEIWGIPWEPEDFVNKALQSKHPLELQNALPEVLKETIDMHAQNACSEIVGLRKAFLLRWIDRARELQGAEADLKKSMDPVVAKCVANKRILVFEEMLKECHFPDMGVIDELKLGADLTGDIPATGMLPKKFLPAMCTTSGLADRSKLMRSALLAEVGSSGDPELDLEVWRQTLQEVDAGWLTGPLEPSEVSDSLPLSKRFGLAQKTKVRLIDNFSSSGVNDLVTVCEAPELHTVDVAAAALLYWLNLRCAERKPSNLSIRTFDLQSAYRQVGLSKAGREMGHICVYDPLTSKPRLFQCQVLPFGAVRSVHSFLRLARAVWWVGVVGCKLIWSSFYDDFIVLTQDALATNTEQCASL